MMTKKEFIERIENEIRDYLPEHIADNCEIKTVEVRKHNDRELIALIVTSKDDNTAAPNFYLDDAYDDYLEYEDLEGIFRDIASFVQFHWGRGVPKKYMELGFEKVKDNLMFCVVDKKMNEKLLADCPHEIDDSGLARISCVCYDSRARLVISSVLAKHEGYDMETVFSVAKKNMEKDYEPILFPISSIVYSQSIEARKADDILSSNTPNLDDVMYVLTNEKEFFGASTIFYDGIKEKIGELFGKSFYAIPCSVHEWIILPDKGAFDSLALKKMLEEGNKSLDADEILSDEVFKYCYASNTFERIAV